MKLSERKQAEWRPQRTLCFGDSKTGKSTLASLLAQRFILDWFDLENGHDVLYKLPQAAQDNINLFVIPDTKDWPIAIETMNKVFKGDAVSICRKHGKSGCSVCKPEEPRDNFDLKKDYGKDRIIIVDSGTQLGISALNRIIHGKPDDFKAGWEEYRSQGTKLDGIYTNIQQAWYHVIVICHTTQARMEDEQKTKLVPVSGTDNYSRNLAKFFDHVVYCDIGVGAHKFGSSTTYRPQVLTGSRLDVAVEKLVGAEKPGTNLLLPIFDGSIKHPSQAQPNATSVLQSAMAQAAKLSAGKT